MRRRMSLVLWESLNEHVVDRMDWVMTEPDINDCLTHGFEAGTERYDRHSFYFDVRMKATAAAALVLGVACLEAYANELSVLIPGLEQDRRASVQPPSLRGRYHRISEVLSGSPFDPNKEPFKSFHRLVELRNRVVHFDMRWDAEQLADEDMTSWVRQTTASMIVAVNSMVNDPAVCLDPEEMAHLTAKRWQRRQGR